MNLEPQVKVKTGLPTTTKIIVGVVVVAATAFIGISLMAGLLPVGGKISKILKISPDQAPLAVVNTDVAEITSPEMYTYIHPRELPKTLTITGTANATIQNLSQNSYQLLYSVTDENNWTAITSPISSVVTSNTLGSWDLSNIPIGDYTIRLVVNTDAYQFTHDLPIHLASRGPARLDNYINDDTYGAFDESDNIDISGSHVVWRDFISDGGYFGTGINNIYTYDFDNPQAGQQLIHTTESYVDETVISGNNVVWFEKSVDEWARLYHYDLDNPSAGAQEVVFLDSGNPISLGISDNNVIWLETVSGFIHHYDLANPSAGAQAVSTPLEYRWSLDTSGTKIVWFNNTTGSNQVFMYDLANPDDGNVQISYADYQIMAVRISGNNIFWSDGYSVYAYDLTNPSEGEQVLFTYTNNGESIMSGFEADGSQIAFLGYRGGMHVGIPINQRAYLYDIDNPEDGVIPMGPEKELSTGGYYNGEITISDNRIIWVSQNLENAEDYTPYIYFYHDWDCGNFPICANYLDDDCDGWLDYQDSELQGTLKFCMDSDDWYTESCVGDNIDRYQCGTAGCEQVQYQACEFGCSNAECLCSDGTLSGQCNQIGAYCDDGALVASDCRTCGCTAENICTSDDGINYVCRFDESICYKYPEHPSCPDDIVL